MEITLEQLHSICDRAPVGRLKNVVDPLNLILAAGEITTPKRLAMFVAQLAHESVEFRCLEEIASGEAYEGRADLGNVMPGDGKRFKGRGWLQLTGRKNYRACGEALGLPLEEQPGLAATVTVGARSAAWYWMKHGLNAPADAGDVERCTHIINGGTNGLEQRREYYRRACVALGVQ